MPTPVNETQLKRTPHTVMRQLQPGWPVTFRTTHSNSEYGLAVADTVSSAGEEVWRRSEQIVDGCDASAVVTIDHKRVVRYTKRDPVRAAQNGVLRVGTHAKYGFGEVRVRPAGDGRVVTAGGDR